MVATSRDDVPLGESTNFAIREPCNDFGLALASRDVECDAIRRRSIDLGTELDPCRIRKREETRRSVSLHLHRVRYFFAAQPQLFPQAQEFLQLQGALHVQRSASPPQPQSVVWQGHWVSVSFVLVI